jgi:hypothetical protein
MALTLHGTVADNTVVLDRRNAKPIIINGDMAVDQRNSGASVTAVDNAYQVDRWRTFSGAASKFTVQQQTSVVPPFFRNAQKITSSSAYSAAAGEAFALNTPIEGGSIANLGFGTANAKYVTLSFLVYSSLTGTFSGSLFNSAWNRSYPFTYSVGSANTWTTIVVAIPGDTSGTWLTTTGTGLVVNFDIGSGSDWKGSADAWASAAYTGVAGSVSIVGTSGATFYITGVQLEVGEFDANSIAPFQHEFYIENVERCWRYFEACEGGGTPNIFGQGFLSDGTGRVATLIGFHPKRAIPTVTSSAAGTFTGSQGVVAGGVATGFIVKAWSANTGANSGVAAGMCHVHLDTSGHSGMTDGQMCRVANTSGTTAFIKCDAEL